MHRTGHVSLVCLAFTFGALGIACGKKQEPAPTPPAASAAPAKPVASASAAALAGPFEGEIVVSVKAEPGKKLPSSIVYDVKGNKIRYAPAEAPVRAVSDLDAQMFYAIDDAQKSYDSIETKAPANAKPATAPKVAKTGKTEKVAGLDCEDWTIDNGDEKVDVCASTGIAYFALASDAKPGNAETPWAVALTSEKAFPLRAVVHDKAGKETYRLEATKADRKKLDDTVFALPTGYKKASLARETKTASLP